MNSSRFHKSSVVMAQSQGFISFFRTKWARKMTSFQTTTCYTFANHSHSPTVRSTVESIQSPNQHIKSFMDQNSQSFATTSSYLDSPLNIDRIRFMDKLSTFLKPLNKSLSKIPTLGGRELDLWTLYCQVQQRGGIREVKIHYLMSRLHGISNGIKLSNLLIFQTHARMQHLR